MALKAPSTDQIILTLLLGGVFLFLITSIINVGAIGKGTCSIADKTTEDLCVASGGVWTSADIMKEVDYTGVCSIPAYTSKDDCSAAGGVWTTGLITQVFTMLIVVFAIYLAWGLLQGFGKGALGPKTLVTMVILGVILYFVWNNILVPSGFIDLPKIEFAAVQLQSMVMP